MVLGFETLDLLFLRIEIMRTDRKQSARALTSHARARRRAPAGLSQGKNMCHNSEFLEFSIQKTPGFERFMGVSFVHVCFY